MMRATMKMSEAILLGYPEIGHTNLTWLMDGRDGRCEGCAIGAALFAMGVRTNTLSLEPYWHKVAELWPWTCAYKNQGTERFMGEISLKYEEVIQGHATIEQLVAWVRGVEAQYDRCPECDHPTHSEPCTVERADSYESGYAPMALGPCSCTAQKE